MIRNIRKQLVVGLAVLVGTLFAGVNSARADLTVEIRDNGGLIASFTDPASPGNIAVGPALIGPYGFVFAANSNSSPVAPFATISLNLLVTLLMDAGPHTLEITFFENDFNFPSFANAVLGLESAASGSILTGPPLQPTSITFQSIAAGSLATPLQVLFPPDNPFSNSVTGTFSPPAIPYELRGVVTIVFPAGAVGTTVQLGAQASVTAVIPEPGTYLLVGAGLAYVGVGYGWRRRKAVRAPAAW